MLFPYNGPGTSNGARPASRDRVVLAFTCRMSASRRKKGRKTLTFLVLAIATSGRPDSWRTTCIWGSRRPQSVEENLGWTRGKDWCSRQCTIGRYRSSLDDKRKYSFFCHFLTKLFFYSYFFLRVMFLYGESKRSSTAAVAPKTNATLSLPFLFGLA